MDEIKITHDPITNEIEVYVLFEVDDEITWEDEKRFKIRDEQGLFEEYNDWDTERPGDIMKITTNYGDGFVSVEVYIRDLDEKFSKIRKKVHYRETVII